MVKITRRMEDSYWLRQPYVAQSTCMCGSFRGVSLHPAGAWRYFYQFTMSSCEPLTIAYLKMPMLHNGAQ